MFSLLAGTNLIARMLTLPIWLWTGQRIGKFKAFLLFNLTLAASQCLFFFVGRDTESCSMMPFLLTSTGIWGMVFGGGLFLRSIMSDIADYDEFLTGKRREAQYVMTIEFLPKFFEVPSEALPILLMAYFGYVRPNNGVLPSQPEAVVWLIRLCVSLVPALFVLAGSAVLCFYPKHARTNEAHEELIVAIREKHAKGLSAEDPWFPGSVVAPPPVAGPHDDLLAYFWPSELMAAIEQDGQSGHGNSLRWGTMKGVAIGLFLLPLGITFIFAGWKDMNSDLGASVSPIGLVFLGVALLLISFDGTRLRATFAVDKRSISQAELVARYNYLCRFTGSDPVLQIMQVQTAEDESIVVGDA
jgi:Na+/melibiose symporter-like transporter